MSLIGISITVGELREQLEGVPDTNEVRVDSGRDQMDPIFRVRHAKVDKDVAGRTIETINNEGRATVLLCLTR